jgi:hypothetical protein
MTGAIALFWPGLLLQFTPVAVRLLRRGVGRGERVRLCILLAVGLLLAHQLAEFWEFNQFDELQHLRSLRDLEATGALFTDNPLLPVSPRFPGLELVTDAVIQLLHVPDQAAGLIVVAAARIMLVGGLFFFAERLTNSSFAAGISVLIYTTSPQFFFFNAQFAYQTLALGLLMVLLVLVVIFAQMRRSGNPVVVLLTMMTGVALALTHHVTSWLGAAFLLVVAVSASFHQDRRARRALIAAALTGILVVGVWALANGQILRSYFLPSVRTAADQLIGIAASGTPARKVGSDSGGTKTPQWEQGLMFLSLLVWAATWLPLPFFRGRPPAGVGISAVFRVLRVMQMLYPLSLAAILSPEAGEFSLRLSSFMFIGIAVVIAYTISARLELEKRRVRALVLAVGVIALVGGNLLGDGPDWERFPGPYMVGADGRGIDRYAVSAAQWASMNLPVGARLAADRENWAIFGASGRQWLVTEGDGGVNAGPVYFATNIDSYQRSLLAAGRIQYLVVDSRLAESPPHLSMYFEAGEAPPGTLLTADELAKFDTTPGSVRVYDNGYIRIYDVRQLWAGGLSQQGASP